MGTVDLNEMIARTSQASGVTPETARQAIGEIFLFLKKEASPEALGEMMDKIPGAGDLLDGMSAPEATIGGLMGLAARLMGLGLGMGEMQCIGREVFACAREAAGDEAVRKVAACVPALAPLV